MLQPPGQCGRETPGQMDSLADGRFYLCGGCGFCSLLFSVALPERSLVKGCGPGWSSHESPHSEGGGEEPELAQGTERS